MSGAISWAIRISCSDEKEKLFIGWEFVSIFSSAADRNNCSLAGNNLFKNSRFFKCLQYMLLRDSHVGLG